jgi:hypothetical protein
LIKIGVTQLFAINVISTACPERSRRERSEEKSLKPALLSIGFRDFSPPPKGSGSKLVLSEAEG